MLPMLPKQRKTIEQQRKHTKAIQNTLKITKNVSPWDSNWVPREPRIRGFPIGFIFNGKTNEKQTKMEETLEKRAPKVLKHSPSDIPIFPLNEPKEASIPGFPIGFPRKPGVFGLPSWALSGTLYAYGCLSFL